MNHDQFRFIHQAAGEIMRLHTQGIKVDPKTVSWAEAILKEPPKAAPFRPSIHHGPIMVCLQMNQGSTAKEISAKTGIIPRALSVALSQMAFSGKIAMYKIPGRSRYFTDRDEMAKALPAIEAEEARRPPSRRQLESGVVERKAARAQAKAEKEAAKPLKVPVLLKQRKEPKPITLLPSRTSKPIARGPAYLPGEPDFSNAKRTIAPPPPAVVYRTSTFSGG